MKNYLVRLRASVPYPKDFDYRLEATSIGRAMNLAYRKFRKEEKIKGTREREVVCVVFPLGAIAKSTETLEEKDVANIVEEQMAVSRR